MIKYLGGKGPTKVTGYFIECLGDKKIPLKSFGRINFSIYRKLLWVQQQLDDTFGSNAFSIASLISFFRWMCRLRHPPPPLLFYSEFPEACDKRGIKHPALKRLVANSLARLEEIRVENISAHTHTHTLFYPIRFLIEQPLATESHFCIPIGPRNYITVGNPSK